MPKAKPTAPTPTEWLQAATSGGQIENVRKTNVTMRIDSPIYSTVKSMAKVLNKKPAGLAAEIFEAAVRRFDQDLRVLRPDLVLRFEDQPEDYQMAYPERDTGEDDPMWLTVAESYALAMEAENPAAQEEGEDD